MNSETPAHAQNFGLELVRTTEGAAIAAARWMGRGNRAEADKASTEAMVEEFAKLDVNGRIVIGEEGRSQTHSIDRDARLGNGNGPQLDVVVDPIDGTNLLVQGRPGALSVVGVAPSGTMWTPPHAKYMAKIVVDRRVADALVPECLDAPPAWTLALVSRVKKKPIRDLVVFVLDRPRHQELIEEIRAAGARVMLRIDGDVAGALLAASPRLDSVDILMGVGRVPEGVIAACAVNALRGAMLGRLAPQSQEEKSQLEKEGADLRAVLTNRQLVNSQRVFFAATGITEGPLLSGVRFLSGEARTESIVLRGETGTRRIIKTLHSND